MILRESFRSKMNNCSNWKKLRYKYTLNETAPITATTRTVTYLTTLRREEEKRNTVIGKLTDNWWEIETNNWDNRMGKAPQTDMGTGSDPAEQDEGWLGIKRRRWTKRLACWWGELPSKKKRSSGEANLRHSKDIQSCLSVSNRLSVKLFL